ncbi:putative ribonuclease H protein [Sesamum angolense]|uniref:Ribonuclease H protein n=1 Tax=Sesamum angolense TaxID=2727404 RepID=A0AAE1T3X7_9LAMI|nr:putative ribonuclease H protein [Sesamum angolense]
MFSVCINGNPHGFFKGSRGLRQGDPMSPFLFVLIMEVLQLMLQQLIDQNEGFSFHWRCKEIGLFQLCFADDLLLFCKADVDSVRIFRQGLDEFAKLSGLHTNPQKSQLILSRSAQPMREHLLADLQFQEGHFPLRYLGLPLLASRLSILDCQPLLLKIDSRIKGWDSIQLSFAGRLQLIKSVLMSLNVYWAMAFILPKGVIRAVEKRMRHFLWKGNSAVGYPKVAWSEVCRPMEEGGLGIRDILALNKALMTRHLWNVIQSSQSSIWVQWIAHTHLRHKSVWTIDAKGGSWGWRKLLRLRSALLPYIEFKVGNGEIFSIWHDPWHSLGTLISRFPSGPSRTNIPIAAKLSAVIVDGDWSWPPITDMECIEILHLLPTIHNGKDSILWRGGEFTTTVAYGIFRTPGPIVGCYSRRCIRDLKEAVRFTWPNRAWGEDIIWASTRWKGRHIVQAAYRALFSAIVYHIWRERNQRVFQHSQRPSTTIARIAAEEIRQKILSLDLSDSKWEPCMVLRKLKHTEVPVWIKLRHLPVELWTTEGLSTMASGIGRPLYPDSITRACTRLDFARVCIMLNVSSKLPKHVVIMMPNELGGESACKVDIEYEWLPPKCTGCASLGHSTKECPLSKQTKPAVAIYVRKPPPPTPAAPKLKIS